MASTGPAETSVVNAVSAKELNDLRETNAALEASLAEYVSSDQSGSSAVIIAEKELHLRELEKQVISLEESLAQYVASDQNTTSLGEIKNDLEETRDAFEASEKALVHYEEVKKELKETTIKVVQLRRLRASLEEEVGSLKADAALNETNLTLFLAQAKAGDIAKEKVLKLDTELKETNARLEEALADTELAEEAVSSMKQQIKEGLDPDGELEHAQDAL